MNRNPEEIAQVNEMLETLDKGILQECLDVRTCLDGKQFKQVDGKLQEIFPCNQYYCYCVLSQSSKNKFFLDKDLLRAYLVSLDPTFGFEKLSELAQHLIDTKVVNDVFSTAISQERANKLKNKNKS